MLTLLLAHACAAPEEDSGEPADDTPPEETEEALTCETLEVRVDGVDPPHVGDTWSVILACDDAVLTGTGRVSVDPPDFASIDNLRVTFLYAGEGTVKMQVGSYRAERAVEVLE
ncbi:MAG: hypothetical protein ACOZNI_35620 [Myxococcota bacterium]